MRPENTEPKDAIDKLMAKSWEDLPQELEYRLMDIPTQLNHSANRFIDPLSTFLNGILLIWGLGLITYLWKPLEAFILNTSNTLIGISGQSPNVLSQPVTGLILMAVLVAGWAVVDLEKHPGKT